jgi:hypothetical protein
MSYIKESYKNCGVRICVFRCISIASKVDNFTIKSLNITLDKKDDWNKNENIDQSNVAIDDVRSQFRESESQIWSEKV